ncbi:S1 RNA-binding domain-containing protein [Demequina sp. SYSU T00039]|uniref:S1 RNA-binding domain-containing protein n=2 Tax=Demequina lignilytica TaxID=3051663 RepID=A0AAW7M798_9MICO|nr:S1 RNA-binding domain-containing protein [Demequina sp. SYSU T00039]MDN4488626.1 S1 RNA-binding domain-containing protein [Demequina sp. SYSU T00039]
MWGQPATAAQLSVLKAHGNYDGKYYSKGRAGQTIGQSVRSAGNSTVAPDRATTIASRALLEAATNHAARRTDARAIPPTTSHSEAIHDYAASAAPDHFIVEEGTLMSQLTVTHHTMANTVELASTASATAVPFDFIAEMERTHLAAVAAQVGAGDPRHVHQLEKGWAHAKVTMATTFARAHNELVAILHEAPAGTIASIEAAANEILWNACSADIERTLMETAQRTKGTTKPSQVIDLLLTEVKHRVETATIIARGQVELATIQAATPPSPNRGYEPAWGEVTGIKPFGAFIRLRSGETGLLHVSEMHVLNGGRQVANPETVLNVGQTVYLRVTGKNDEGKLNFAPAKEA